MHKTILTNMIVQLRGNALDIHDVPLQPMSRHKWRIAEYVAKQIDITPYIAAPLMAEPDYDVSEAQMFNFISNRRFIHLKDAEMDSKDVSEDTLRLLEIIVANADAIILTDVNIKGILAMAVFIQRHKDTIDYDKLNAWIRYLGLLPMVSFLCSILIDTLHMPEDDIMIIHRHNKRADKAFRRSLRKSLEKHTAGFSLRMKLAPIETISYGFFHAITRITDIEE